MRPLTKLNFKQHWPGKQQGAVIVLVVIALAAILLMGALALDGGHMLLNKTRLQNAVDAAALSGAKTLSRVEGSTAVYLEAEADALATLLLNAKAKGNQELLDALGTDGVAGFADVKFAPSVYGPFRGASEYAEPNPAKYVQVSVLDYNLTVFFLGLLKFLDKDSVIEKSVAAVATAGPSPSANPCDLVPLMVCGVPDEDSYWGYNFGDFITLKTASSDTPVIGPGNFQLLDFGSGGKTVGDLLAGGGEICPGKVVQTKPGNTVGPSVMGVNTRLGKYQGAYKESDYPPDLVVTHDEITYDTGTGKAMHDGAEITTNGDGGLLAGGSPVYGYNNWVDDLKNCPSGCEDNGKSERRILKIVIGDCTGKNGGASSIDVLGFGCFFLVGPANHSGQTAQIFGQFVKKCEGDGVAGPVPTEDAGPNIIQLYKTYTDDSGTPSKDS